MPIETIETSCVRRVINVTGWGSRNELVREEPVGHSWPEDRIPKGGDPSSALVNAALLAPLGVLERLLAKDRERLAEKLLDEISSI